MPHELIRLVIPKTIDSSGLDLDGDFSNFLDADAASTSKFVAEIKSLAEQGQSMAQCVLGQLYMQDELPTT